MDLLGKKQLSYCIENGYKDNNYPTWQSIDFCCLLHANNFLCPAFCLHVSSVQFCRISNVYFWKHLTQGIKTLIHRLMNSDYHVIINFSNEHEIDRNITSLKNDQQRIYSCSNMQTETNSNAACTQNEEKNNFLVFTFYLEKKSRALTALSCYWRLASVT